MSDKKLWLGTALTPYGNQYGSVVVFAETKEDAISAAKEKLSDVGSYTPDRRYSQALLDNLTNIQEVPDGAFVDWSPVRT